jgi:CheY-like chemotaxis protein
MADPEGDAPLILVVDDETGVRDVVRRVLLNEGYRVIDARDGQDALGVAQNFGKPLDLLLTDLKMPRMDGRQLADALRERQPDLKVLFLTAYADTLFADRAMLGENTAYVEKPVSSKGLNEAVRLLLFGSLAAAPDATDSPAMSDLSVASENEYLRVALPDGGSARVLFSGTDPSAADLQAVIVALRRRLDTQR